MIYLPRYYHNKPPLGSEINLKNPLTQGLVSCFVMNERGGRAYDVMNKQIAVTTLPVWGHYMGSGSLRDSVHTNASTLNLDANALGQKFTLLARFAFSGNPTGFHGGNIAQRADWSSAFNNRGFVWGMEYSPTGLSFWNFGNNDFYPGNRTRASNPGAGKWHSGAVRFKYDTNATDMWINGKQDVVNGSNSGSLGASSTGALYLGSNGNNCQVYVDYFYAFNRTLTKEELLEFHIAPYQIFTQPRRPLIYLPAGGGGGTTIDIPAGALQFTGQVPTVVTTAHQTIAIPAGAFTFTGQIPVVEVGADQTIAIPAGAFTFTGQAPTVDATADQTIPVPAGSFTFTGQVPTVTVGNHVTVEIPAGAVQLAGQVPVIDVTQDANIAIPAGSIVFTGEVLTVVTTEDQIISIPAGTLQLTGHAPVVSIPAGGDNDTYLQVDPTNPDILNLYVEGTLLAAFSKQNIAVNGGLALKVATKTAAYTATVRDAILLCDATAAAFSVTLPAAAGAEGLILFIKKTDASANAVTIDGDGSEEIDGSTTLSLPSQYDAARLVSSGSGWSKV